MNMASGFPQFFSLDGLNPHDSPFFVGDTLFFKCSVDINQCAVAGAIDDHNGTFTDTCVGPPAAGNLYQ